MIAFFSSLGLVGWLLIALAAFTLWQLPSIVRMALFGDRVARLRPYRHGKQALDTTPDPPSNDH